MEPLVAIACVALAAATLVFIFFFDPDPADSAPQRGALDQLLERRDTIYENLRDLKFEHRAGKYSEADFEEMRRALEVEAAQVLAQIEGATGGVSRPIARESSGVAKPRV